MIFSGSRPLSKGEVFSLELLLSFDSFSFSSSEFLESLWLVSFLRGCSSFFGFSFSFSFSLSFEDDFDSPSSFFRFLLLLLDSLSFVSSVFLVELTVDSSFELLLIRRFFPVLLAFFAYNQRKLVTSATYCTCSSSHCRQNLHLLPSSAAFQTL